MTLFNKLIKKFGSEESLIDSLLKSTQLFNSLSAEQLAELKKSLKTISCKSGDAIIKKGDIGDHFYIIKEGSVRVYVLNPADNSEIALARIDEGGFFGEQALLDEVPGKRTSNVKALTDCEFYIIPHAAYFKILNPEIKNLAKKIGETQLKELFYNTQKSISSIDQTIFKGCSGKINKYSDGDILFKAGDKADQVYFIISGTVVIEIPTDGEMRKTELTSGALFGELGILNKSQRAGTAVAKGDLQVYSFDVGAFEALYKSSPELQQYINSLRSIYRVTHRGTVKIYHGKLLDLNAVVAIYTMKDGSTIKSAKTIGNLAFSMGYDKIEGATAINYSRGADVRRKLEIKDHKILSVVNFGDWPELSEVCNLLLNSQPITDDQIHQFKSSGSLGLQKLTVVSDLEKQEILCKCMNISKGQIFEVISQGINKLNDITDKTGAGSVCGCCRPKIAELVGLKAWHTVKLLEKIPLRDDICSFRFQLLEPTQFEYKPGQYVTISALINDQLINRSYTLTSISRKDPYIELTVKKEPKGYFSNWLFDQAKDNSLIRISAPNGDFTFNEKEETPVVCFVGGIGVTPAVAYARYIAQHNQRRLHIDYSDKTQDNFIFKDELGKLTSTHKNMTVHFRATQKEGRIQPEHISKIIQDFPQADFFICGPDSFEKAISGHLNGQKVAPSKIRTEKFTDAGRPVTGKPTT